MSASAAALLSAAKPAALSDAEIDAMTVPMLIIALDAAEPCVRFLRASKKQDLRALVRANVQSIDGDVVRGVAARAQCATVGQPAVDELTAADIDCMTVALLVKALETIQPRLSFSRTSRKSVLVGLVESHVHQIDAALVRSAIAELSSSAIAKRITLPARIAAAEADLLAQHKRLIAAELEVFGARCAVGVADELLVALRAEQ